MPHAFANTLKTFKTASGKTGSFYSLPELAKTVSQRRRACRSRCASSSSRCCATATARRSRPSTWSRSPAGRPKAPRLDEIPFVVARVVLQDFTGVPLLADLAAMRNVAKAMGKDAKSIEPLVPVDLVVDHSVHDRLLRLDQGARPEHEARVQAQPRALPVHEVGHAGVRHLRRRAAGLRHRPPGQPRVPGARRPQGRSARSRRAGRLLPRLARRHRQPHDHDQRHRRRRLGRRRDRGRGGDARPAGLLPDSRRRRLRVQRRAARRRHRDRPGARRDRDPAQGEGGRQVRRVLRRRRRRACRFPTARRWPTWRPSTARRWASSRSTTRPSSTSRAPAAPTSEIEAFQAYFKAQGLYGMPRAGAIDYSQVVTPRPRHGDAEPGRPQAPAGPDRDRQASRASSPRCSASRRPRTASTSRRRSC